MKTEEQHPILLFDGVCNLCNGLVKWVINRDPNGKIHFASLQSERGQELQRKFNIDPDQLDSVILIHQHKAATKSKAAILLAQQLGGIYSVMGIFLIVPTPIRDVVYDFIARNRYRWFGRSNACLLPRPEWKSRFLTD